MEKKVCPQVHFAEFTFLLLTDYPVNPMFLILLKLNLGENMMFVMFSYSNFTC